MKNSLSRTMLIIFIVLVGVGVIVSLVYYFFYQSKTSQPIQPSQNTQTSTFSPVSATYFLLPDNTKEVQGNFVLSQDNKFIFLVARLVRTWVDNNDVYASIQTDTITNPQPIMLYSHLENLVFSLQVQHTLDFFPTSANFIQHTFQDTVNISNIIKPYEGKLAIITLQVDALNPLVGREKIFSILNNHAICNKTFFDVIQQKKNENVSCSPYVTKIAVYGK